MAVSSLERTIREKTEEMDRVVREKGVLEKNYGAIKAEETKLVNDKK